MEDFKELTKDFIEEHKLDDAQAEAVSKHFKDIVIPDVKKSYDGRANENAEAILSGAVKFAVEKNGVALDREKGEKWGDYLARYSDTVLVDNKKALSDKQAEIEDKLKNFKGGEEYKTQLDALEAEKDTLLQKVAKLEPLEGLSEKYDTATQELSGLKLSVAFNGVKPNFSNDVNEFEAKARWEAFQKRVLEENTIEIVDGEGIAVSKENKHKTVKLSDLVKQDEELTKLVTGRQQGGTGADAKDLIEVKDLPFKIPKDPSSEELSTVVREYLIKKLGDPLHIDFSKQFIELLKKAKDATK